MSTSAKASIHIKPCNIAQSEAHNRRDKEYLKSLDPKKIYIRLDLISENETYISPGMGGKTLQEYLNMLRDMVKEKTGRAMQEEDVKYKDKNGKTHSRRGSSPLREGVVVIKETTTMEDLLKFTDSVQERWGINAIQIHIHRDEGHYEDIDRRIGWKPNLHAHIVWDWMDHSAGKSRKLNVKDMSQMQDLLAEVLEMQRGQRKSETGLEHLERNEFILKKQEAKNQALREDRDNLLSTLKSIGNAMDIKEEDLFVHNLVTDPLVNAALESINSELATPFPVLGGKEEWRTDRLKAVKKILTDLQTKLRGLSQRLANLLRPTADAESDVTLTPREVDVLSQVALGCTNIEAGQRLSLRPETVKSYLRSAMGKLDASSRHEAVVTARRLGLLP